MKIPKKALSILLAVVMIITSTSVCFGSVSLAAGDEIQQFISAVKCDVMKNLSITKLQVTRTGSAGKNSGLTGKKNSTYVVTQPFTVTAENYSDYTAIINVIKKFNNAVQSIDEYSDKHTHVTDATCNNSDSVCTDFRKLRTAFISEIGTETYSLLADEYNLDSFLDAVFNADFGQYGPGGTEQSVFYRDNPHDSGSSGYSTSVAEKVFNKLTVTLSFDAFMKSFTDPEEIPDEKVKLSYEYITAMGRQNYKINEKKKDDWWAKDYYYYHTCVNTQQLGYFSQLTEENEADSCKADFMEMKTALNDNKDYLKKTDIKGILSLSKDPVTLNNIAVSLETAHSKLKDFAEYFDLYFNDSNYGNVSYDSLSEKISLIKNAAAVGGYEGICETIKTDYNIYKNEIYKSYSSTEINALFNQLKTAYETFKAADDAFEVTVAVYYGIDSFIDRIPQVLDALENYYYEIFLGSIAKRAFGDNNNGYISAYSAFTVEDIDNDIITSADILTFLNEVSLDIDTLSHNASDEDIQSFFGISKSELLTELTLVKNHLENPLGYYAGLNDELYEQYKTFTNNIANVIDADSSELYRVLSSYESWYTELQTFFTLWEAQVGEYRELLEDGLKEEMNSYMAQAYVALQTRVENQIGYAYDLYEVYYSLYENNVTMASLTYFNTLKKAIEAIETDAYNWLKVNSLYGEISDEAIGQYDNLQVIYGQYGTFVANRGFDTYTQTLVETVRPDTDKDIARKNENGEYKTTDEDIEKIIRLIESALKDDEIKALIGEISGAENFDIADILGSLIANLYSDQVINSLISTVYPIVAKAFLDVWQGIDPVVSTSLKVLDAVEVDIYAEISLYDVDTAIESVGIAIAPVNLAHFIERDADSALRYASVIEKLKSVTAKTRYNADGEYVDPWKSAVLYKDITDKSTTEAKQVMNLEWGVTDRESFIDALCAALSGLEPLISALMLNKNFTTPANSAYPNELRGGQIGVSAPGSTVSKGIISAPLTLDPITLMLSIGANDGWDNVLAPIFEALDLENIPHSEDMLTMRDFLEKGLFAMVDQLIEKLVSEPLGTILDAVPNLVYALEADLVTPLLGFLEADINYSADVHYKADILGGIEGNASDVFNGNAYINIGEMLDLESMGINLSGGLAGILQLVGADIPLPDVSVLATAGKLIWQDSNRSKVSYSYQPEGVSDKTAHIEANRADVFEYLLRYAMENLSEILSAVGVDTDEMSQLVSAVIDNLAKNADSAVAAVAELFSQKIYNTLEKYQWYGDENEAALPSERTNQNKADYLYDNLESIINSALAIAGAKLTLERMLSDAVDGLLSDKTLTALTVFISEIKLGDTLNSLIKELLGIDLEAVSDQYDNIAKAVEADESYIHNFGVDEGTKTFAAALAEILRPFEKLTDFILSGENLEITIGDEKIVLQGADGYNSAIIPILEALGCEVVSETENALEATVNALVSKVKALTVNTEENPKDGVIYGIVDMLPGVMYFIASGGISTAVRNLLQPVYVILDTIRPIYDVDLNALIGEIETDFDNDGIKESLGLDINKIDAEFLVSLISRITGFDFSELSNFIYDVCSYTGTHYTSESSLQTNWKKGAYSESFTQADMLSALISFAIEWVSDKENAQAVGKILGEDVYSFIMNLMGMGEVSVQDFSWMDTDKADTDYVFSAINSSEIYEGFSYGPQYTEEMAKYVADNFGEFADNIIYLAGIKIGGKNVDNLTDLINGLLGGSLYNSENIVALRDALADVLSDITNLEVSGETIGGIIADVLKITGIADIRAVGDVDIREFTENRGEFVLALCDVLEPLYGILRYLLADEDISLFTSGTESGAITLKGAEGYAYGIIPILEVLDCKDILTPDEYYSAVRADGDVLLTSVIDPVLNRIDEILSDEDPAQRILDMLPNIIYFINSNGVDTVVRNTLNAVFSLLGVIEPLAKIDLYEIIGVDLAVIDFQWLFDKLLEVIADETGYAFEGLDANAIKELSVGKLVSYKSLSGKTAYKMVYAGENIKAGSKTEMVVVIERLLVTFIMHENNRNLLLGLMRDYLGLTADAEKYVSGVLEAIAENSVETKEGMDKALTTLYYIYLGADISVGSTASGIKDINKLWTEILRSMRESDDMGESMAGEIIAGILDLDIFDDIIDSDDGIAPNGLIAFFRKIGNLFRNFGEWLGDLFSFGN